MKKKSIEYIFNKIFGVNEKSCDVIGCKNPGGYEAPKSPNSKEKYSFCLSHVKEYNKRWNFFAGKSQSQIHDYQKNDFFIGRPTRPFSKGVSSKIKFEFEYYFDNDTLNFERIKENKNTNFNKKISTEIKRCLKIFDIKDDFNEQQLKKKYKELVKKYHPDIHGQNKQKEKLLKKVNNCYKILKKLLGRNNVQ